MTLTKYGLYGAFAASMVLAMPAHAILLVDDFTDPNGPGNSVVDLTVDANGVGNTYDAAGVLGGERDLYVKLLQAGNSSTSGVDMSVNSGSLTYETGSGAIGMGSIQYDGDDNDPLNVDIDGLGSVDFTADGGRAFILDILESDVGFSFAINVWSDAGNDFVSNIYTALGANVPTQRIFNFSDFVGIDFTDVSALEFVINTDGTQGDTSIDFAVDAIRVPAPASIAFLGMGLLSLGYARRRHS